MRSECRASEASKQETERIKLERVAVRVWVAMEGEVGCGRLVSWSTVLLLFNLTSMDFWRLEIGEDSWLFEDVILPKTNSQQPIASEKSRGLVHVIPLRIGRRFRGQSRWNFPEDLMARLQCCVCMEAPRCTLLEPCSHYALCFSCARKMTQCPLCRRNITSIQCTLSGWIFRWKKRRFTRSLSL